MSRPVQRAAAPGGPDFEYQPALDGVRGLALALVLCFHGGFAWMSGGYVGVSVFFTLSGFLITSLLIIEHRRSGRVSWRGFIARRAKRLLPASLLCLALIAVLAAAGRFATVPHLRRDVLSAALQVANWNALSQSDSYADLLSRSIGVQSPVDHFWSLSVEEQFYWVWPLAFVALVRFGRRPGRIFALLVALAVAAVAAARLIALHWGPDVAYSSTPARVGEILVGAAVAGGCVFWQQRPKWLGWVGSAGLAVVLWAALAWPSRGGPAYGGWFGAFSLSSAALILGLQVDGPLRRVVSLAPLVGLGRISYGVYVFHWPVFLLITARTVPLDGLALFALRVSVTLVVATLSYWLIEQPVRRSVVSPGRVALVGLPVMVASVLLIGLVVPVQPAGARVRAASPSATLPAGTSTTPTRSDSLAGSTSSSAAPSSSAPMSTSASTSIVERTSTISSVERPIGVLLLGDSTAEVLEPGLDAWAAIAPNRAVRSLARPGCGLVRDSSMLGDPGDVFLQQCAEVLDHELPAVLAEQHPDTAVIFITMSDVVSREWSSDEGALPSTDDRYVERMLADYRVLADQLLAGGVRHILWLVPPIPATWWYGWAATSAFVAETWAPMRSVLDTVAADHPAEVEVVRLDEWFQISAADVDTTVRPDGLHMSPEGAARVIDEFLGPMLLQLGGV